MEIAAVVFKHNFDKSMLDQIDTLRTIRLNLAEKMLSNMAQTAEALKTRGLVDEMELGELHRELTGRVATLKERIKRPDVVFADEIDLYVDLLDTDLEPMAED